MIKVKPHSWMEHLIVSNLVICVDSYHTRSVLSCDMRPPQRNSGTSSCSTHSCGFPIISELLCHRLDIDVPRQECANVCSLIYY